MNQARDYQPGSPQFWLSLAESHLRLAEVASNSGEILPILICFHAHQAVAKSLQAVLSFHQIDFPLTQDLDCLLDAFDFAGLSIPAELMGVGKLTPCAWEMLYPGAGESFSGDEVQVAMGTARQTVLWARQAIGDV